MQPTRYLLLNPRFHLGGQRDVHGRPPNGCLIAPYSSKVQQFSLLGPVDPLGASQGRVALRGTGGSRTLSQPEVLRVKIETCSSRRARRNSENHFLLFLTQPPPAAFLRDRRVLWASPGDEPVSTRPGPFIPSWRAASKDLCRSRGPRRVPRSPGKGDPENGDRSARLKRSFEPRSEKLPVNYRF